MNIVIDNNTYTAKELARLMKKSHKHRSRRAPVVDLTNIVDTLQDGREALVESTQRLIDDMNTPL